MSLVEALANVALGYVLAITTQIVVFPWFGIDTGLTEHLTIGLAFVGVSLLRGFLLRRLFEAIIQAGKPVQKEALPTRYTRFPTEVGQPRQR